MNLIDLTEKGKEGYKEGFLGVFSV